MLHLSGLEICQSLLKLMCTASMSCRWSSFVVKKGVDMEFKREMTIILTDWAYDYFQERTLGALVEHEKG